MRAGSAWVEIFVDFVLMLNANSCKQSDKRLLGVEILGPIGRFFMKLGSASSVLLTNFNLTHLIDVKLFCFFYRFLSKVKVFKTFFIILITGFSLVFRRC